MERQYFSEVRDDAIQFLDESLASILDVGCGTGATLVHLKHRGIAKNAVGVDIIEQHLLAVSGRV